MSLSDSSLQLPPNAAPGTDDPSPHRRSSDLDNRDQEPLLDAVPSIASSLFSQDFSASTQSPSLSSRAPGAVSKREQRERSSTLQQILFGEGGSYGGGGGGGGEMSGEVMSSSLYELSASSSLESSTENATKKKVCSSHCLLSSLTLPPPSSPGEEERVFGGAESARHLSLLCPLSHLRWIGSHRHRDWSRRWR
jgi:hypothetical protein